MVSSSLVTFSDEVFATTFVATLFVLIWGPSMAHSAIKSTEPTFCRVFLPCLFGLALPEVLELLVESYG